ncbi:hypothetical protein [Kaistia terrae]|uniref:Uncharacterized protein n=1 Tax=Kaistia terrae TaxID=537017 RepID=A0ABW0PP32_9HYPH|nr:hypothetical protein [Kaistia terrae]MCX5580207.1 hypothetical protein [Kaistia terrae]
MGRHLDDSNNGGTESHAEAIRRHEQAVYIADMVKELRGLSAGVGLEFLSYLLAIAEEEARKESQRLRQFG